MAASTPARIGRYAILGPVGRGGMGEVHRARAFGAAGVTKELCIKRIRRSKMADPGALARFVDEARLWMRLSHGNIVPVFDFGRIENDYYLAMEWIDGCDLRALLEHAVGTACEDETALYVGAEIARALAYLHDATAHEGRAVTHCDLKPSNVLVSRSGEVKLADFGVAVATESVRAGGTRGYIPPSEARGSRVGEPADLYALGRVLDELLRGGEPASVERESARAIARRLVDGTSLRARDVEGELEALGARVRVASGRSARELLMDRVARVAKETARADATPPEEIVETDASFVTEGDDERSFFSQMDAGSERSTASRDTPTPTPRPRDLERIAAAIAIIVVILVVGALATPNARPTERGAPAAPSIEPPVELAATPTPSPAPTAPVAAIDSASDAVPTIEEIGAAERTAVPHAPRRAASDRPAAATPEPAPTAEVAHVRINARPWAEVTIDGEPIGTTPLVDVELEAGEHTIRFLHPVTGREVTQLVDLGAGEHRDIVVDLRP